MSTSSQSGRLSTKQKVVGNLSLLASLAIWLGTISFVFINSNSIPVVLYAASILGGLLSGIFGAIRQAPMISAGGGGSVGFRTLSTLIGSAVWVYVLKDFWAHGDFDPHWVTFVICLLSYTVVRDVCQSILVATVAKGLESQKEAEMDAQRARLLARAKERAAAAGTGERPSASDARISHGPSDAIRNQGDPRGYHAGSPNGRGDDADLSDEHLRPAVAGGASGLRVLADGQSDEDGSSGPASLT